MKLKIFKILSIVFLSFSIGAFGLSVNNMTREKMRINKVYETELVNQMEEALVSLEEYNKTKDLTYYLTFINYTESILSFEESNIALRKVFYLDRLYNDTLSYEKNYPVHDTKLLEEAFRLNLESIKNGVTLGDDLDDKVFDAYQKYYDSSEVRR